MSSADALIEAIRLRGSDATELRDAAHEACHAITCGVPDGKWNRDTIHRYVEKGGWGRAARGEIVARLVEQEVCQSLGVETKNLDHWIFISCMEAMHHRIPFLNYEQAAETAARIPRNEVTQLAGKILALVKE